jgi:predicted unusual protein kinase regulating ubiquinone biosynthesis (AarF/ABC1/UbiB family)
MRRARYRRTMRFFTATMLRELWWDVLLPRVGFAGLSRRTRAARMRRIAARYRELAVRMGGVLIKVGQFMSSRLDVLPREITTELAGLQDEVGAEPFSAIRGVVEAEFGVPLEEKFASFEPVPSASASIGQVHLARLCRETPAGSPCPAVIVKVQRPAIGEIVEADLAAIRRAGRWLLRLRSVRRHMNVPALIEELARSLAEEMDYEREGKNAERFAELFADRDDVRVPTVIWSHTTRRVLCLEDVGAIKISDYAGIEAAGIDRSEVAARLLEVSLKQVFEDGFFHADPHPGNLFVLPSPTRSRPRGWKLVYVDFGMTGTLEPASFEGLREVLFAVGTRDPERLVRAFDKLGVLLPSADREEIQRACRVLFDAFWGKSTREMMRMSNAEVAAFADQFGALIYEMPFQVPENLILLGRCVSILSGLASGLDPDFSVWNGLAPYVQRLIQKEGGAGFRRVLKEVGDIGRLLLGMPRRLNDLAARLEQGRIEVKVPEVRHALSRLERSVRLLAAAVVFAGVLIAGAMLYLGGHPRLALGAAIGDLVVVAVILLRR